LSFFVSFATSFTQLMSVNQLLGSWATDATTIKNLAEGFRSASPFSHVQIDGFFSEEFAAIVNQYFPVPGPDQSSWRESGYCVYDNPIEGKLAIDKRGLEALPAPGGDEMRRIFELFQSEEFVTLMRAVTSMPELEIDEHLHGAGLHYHPTGSRLAMHLDYSIHPLTGKERRVNLIVYMNPNWNEDWNGGLELWHSGMSRCGKRYIPGWNQAVLFQTSDESYHGVPDELQCPEGEGRRSIAVYYVSEPRKGVAVRPKAVYYNRPTDPDDAGVRELMRIRETRLIMPDDLARHTPAWRPRWPGVTPMVLPQPITPSATTTTTGTNL
jgi:hypothetical protein